MKTLFLDCSMGAAGDMLMAALLELHPAPQTFLQHMNALGLPGVCVKAQPSVKCGIAGTHVEVTVHGEAEHSGDRADGRRQAHAHAVHTHEPAPHAAHTHVHGDGPAHMHMHEHSHSHADMPHIEHIVRDMPLAQEVKDDVLAVYQSIAEAESHVHGRPVEEIHFHEVGSLDAIADVTGVCLLMHELRPEQVLATPVHVGSGQVRCAHGVLPVPAPATAYLLRGIPMYGGAVQGELCTPTGAALLRHFVKSFETMPVMRAERIGYGMGKKDFEAANCVRAILGETGEDGSEVVQLCCNLDDMTPEAIGFAQEVLMGQGALDVYTTAIGMKKGRPGVLLTCMCRREQTQTMLTLLFRHTTTLGVREEISRRYTLRRTVHTLATPCGPVRLKHAEGWGSEKEKPEYEDIARIAREKNISLAEARALAGV